jgi:energy-coupling factor transporter ATP-binding protein EcfA2
MANIVLIVGESGSGKSRSIKNLNSKETFIINVNNKALPFKGWKDKYPLTADKNCRMSIKNDAIEIQKSLEFIDKKMPEIKVIVIDDYHYMMSLEFVRRIKEKGFEKYNDLAANFVNCITKAKDCREDLTIFFLAHTEDEVIEGKRYSKVKTVGRFVNDKIVPEGFFTIVLESCIIKKDDDKVEYMFKTNATDECSIVKSPEEMFVDKLIPNDLAVVLTAIKNYEKE